MTQTRMRSRRIAALLGLLVVSVLAFPVDHLLGCGNGGAGRGQAAGLGRGGNAGGQGRGGAAGGANAPGAPGNSGLPGAPGGPPAGSGLRPQAPPADLATGVNELSQTFGVQVRGSYNKKDVDQTLVWARSFRPDETRGVTFTFTAQRRESGVLGVWNSLGQSQIYSGRQDVVFHEGVHHITLFGRNQRSRALANQVFNAAVQEGGGGTPAGNTITRSYAQTNPSEWKAEFFTGLAGLERGVPLLFTLRNNSFNPSANVRAVARQLYVN